MMIDKYTRQLRFGYPIRGKSNQLIVAISVGGRSLRLAALVWLLGESSTCKRVKCFRSRLSASLARSVGLALVAACLRQKRASTHRIWSTTLVSVSFQCFFHRTRQTSPRGRTKQRSPSASQSSQLIHAIICICTPVFKLDYNLPSRLDYGLVSMRSDP